jgi:hypothetical protein
MPLIFNRNVSSHPLQISLGELSVARRLGRELGQYRFVGDFGLLVGPLISTILLSMSMQRAALLVIVGLILTSAGLVAVLVPETNSRLNRTMSSELRDV